MWQHKDELAELDIQVCVVTFDSGPLVKNYARTKEWDWPLLIDEQRSLYSGYSMEHGNWWSIYRPTSIWKYLKLIFRGRLPGKPGSDYRQFGGDILIDPDGEVQLQYASSTPHDRPSVEQLLSVARDA